jgi:hypothetical protein
VKPHPRIRKTVKWGGIVMCVVMAGVWISSAWWYVTWWRDSGTVIGIGDGGFGFDQILKSPIPPSSQGIHFGYQSWTFHWWFRWEKLPPERFVNIPIWTLALLAAIQAVFAWRLDTLARRRARVGFCPKCRYDRTGHPAESPCPECGAVPARSPHAVA